MKNIAAIKKFMESGKDGGKVELGELKVLSTSEREKLGDLCRTELGVDPEDRD